MAQSCLTLCDPWTIAHQTPLSMGFSSKNTGVGCHALLQQVFPPQEPNPGLPRCRWILYRLSLQGVFCVTLFIYLSLAGSSLLRGLLSSCGASWWRLCCSLVWAPRCVASVDAPLYTASVVVALGLGCSAACGILPDQGSNPGLLHWQVGSLPLSHKEGPVMLFLSVHSETQQGSTPLSIHNRPKKICKTLTFKSKWKFKY